MFTDPSGNSTNAWAEISTGLAGLAVAGAGLVLSVATAGAATPIAVMGIVTASTLIGGGISSATYSIQCATTGDNWNIGQWAGNIAIGAISGGVSGGLGIAAGSFVSAATSGIKSFATRGILTVGAGISLGGAADGTINVLSTLAQNGISGAPLLSGVGAAAIGGAIGGGIGGGFGSIAGVRARVARKYKVDKTSRGVFNSINGHNDSHLATSPTGAVWALDTNNGKIIIGQFEGNPRIDKTAHAVLVDNSGYEATGMRYTGGRDGHRDTYPGLKGVNMYKNQSGGADIGFSSTTLNGYVPGLVIPIDSSLNEDYWLNPATLRYEVLSALRDAGIRPSPNLRSKTAGVDWSESNTAKFIMFFLRTPLP